MGMAATVRNWRVERGRSEGGKATVTAPPTADIKEAYVLSKSFKNHTTREIT